MEMTKIQKIGIGAIVVLLVVFGALYLAKSKKVIVSEKAKSTPKQAKVTKTEVAVDKVPTKFPADIPIEARAKITQNYNAESPDGQFQATRVFVSTKTLAENLSIYQSYLKTKGWDLKSTVDQDNYKMLYATKNNTQLQINLNENPTSKTKTVSITYTESAVITPADQPTAK
jgi:hypothetical protein